MAIRITGSYFSGIQAVLSGSVFSCENEVLIEMENSTLIECKSLSKVGGVIIYIRKIKNII